MILWLDIETGGLNPDINPLLSLGYMITDEDLIIFHSREIFVKNTHNLVCDPQAMQVNKIDLNDPRAIEPVEAIKIFMHDVKKFFGNKRLKVGGHNIIKFDLKFLEKFFERERMRFEYSNKVYDTMILSMFMNLFKIIKTESDSMDTLVPYFKIRSSANHSALSDVSDLVTILKNFKRLRLHKQI
jgi:DNA polymerase III epsilon subunit-like protein